MQTEEWTEQSTDGLKLYFQTWKPQAEPVAVICLVHGLGEHSGRYTHMAQYLTDTGYAVLSFDLRGHGRSQGPRGHAPGFEALMDDIGLLLKASHNRYPGKPRFLYGHSLGGLLTLNFVLRCKPQLNGVIVTSAGLRTALHKQKLKVAMCRLGSGILPTLALDSGLEHSALSRYPEVVRKYKDDPLVHDQVSFGLGACLLDAVEWTFAHATKFPTLPLLIMHGKEDRIAYWTGSQEFASLVKGDCTLKVWEGCYHELHNEPEQAEVFAFVLDWLEERR